MEDATIFLDKVIDFLLDIGPSFLLALFVIFAGLWIIKKLMKIIIPFLQKGGFSAEICSFLGSLISISLKVLLFFTVAGIVGIDTAGFIAVLAAAGFAVGLALQGSLGNFAAGIVILMFRPYRVGDWVEIQGKFGKVEDIQIFNTIVVSPGQKILIIPNGEVINGIVTNFSTKGYIRIELEITMAYAESYPRIAKIITDELAKVEKILDDPPPEIGIASFDSHNIIVNVRPYVLPDDYWEVYYEVYENIKNAFYRNKVKVAYSEGVEMGIIGE